MNLKNIFIVIFASLYVSLYADDNDRAPRLDAPPVTSPISVVVPSLDLGAVFQALARINCKIGNVNQEVCDDTVLSVLGDACDILGISISEALSILLDCCDQTPTIELTCTVDLNGVFTTLENLVVTATVDFTEIFTVLQDIEDTLTTCCDTLEQDFQDTWTILEALNVLIINDFNGTWTILEDLGNTVTECCTIIESDFEATWTILADLNDTITECCATLEQDFQFTWTILADLNDSFTDCCSTIEEDFQFTWTILADLNDTITDCCATLEQDFQFTWTILADLNDTFTDCCSTIEEDFQFTWTILADLNDTITECCSTLEADFQNTWTILADLRNTLTNCGMPTAITQEMIPFTITEPGLYCLAEDVTIPAGATGITVTDLPAIIDLNDHRMSGGAIGVDVGSSAASEPFAVLIKNGNMTGQTTAGIRTLPFSISPECIITDIVFENIPVGAAGINDSISVLSVYNCEFNGNFFLGAGEGIISSSSTGVIKDCHFNVCNSGIQVTGAQFLVIEDCVIHSPADLGITLSGQMSTIRNVNVTQASITGAIIISGNNILIEHCDLIRNLSRGISISSTSERINILGCSIFDTFLGGIGIAIDGTEVIVSGCSLNGNDTSGIDLSATSANCEVVNNIIIGTGASTGISNAGAANRIYRNYATNNGVNYSGVTPVNSPGGALTGTFSDFIANVSN